MVRYIIILILSNLLRFCFSYPIQAPAELPMGQLIISSMSAEALSCEMVGRYAISRLPSNELTNVNAYVCQYDLLAKGLPEKCKESANWRCRICEENHVLPKDLNPAVYFKCLGGTYFPVMCPPRSIFNKEDRICKPIRERKLTQTNKTLNDGKPETSFKNAPADTTQTPSKDAGVTEDNNPYFTLQLVQRLHERLRGEGFWEHDHYDSSRGPWDRDSSENLSIHDIEFSTFEEGKDENVPEINPNNDLKSRIAFDFTIRNKTTTSPSIVTRRTVFKKFQIFTYLHNIGAQVSSSWSGRRKYSKGILVSLGDHKISRAAVEALPYENYQEPPFKNFNRRENGNATNVLFVSHFQAYSNFRSDLEEPMENTKKHTSNDTSEEFNPKSIGKLEENFLKKIALKHRRIRNGKLSAAEEYLMPTIVKLQTLVDTLDEKLKKTDEKLAALSTTPVTPTGTTTKQSNKSFTNFTASTRMPVTPNATEFPSFPNVLITTTPYPSSILSTNAPSTTTSTVMTTTTKPTTTSPVTTATTVTPMTTPTFTLAVTTPALPVLTTTQVSYPQKSIPVSISSKSRTSSIKKIVHYVPSHTVPSSSRNRTFDYYIREDNGKPENPKAKAKKPHKTVSHSEPDYFDVDFDTSPEVENYPQSVTGDENPEVQFPSTKTRSSSIANKHRNEDKIIYESATEDLPSFSDYYPHITTTTKSTHLRNGSTIANNKNQNVGYYNYDKEATTNTQIGIKKSINKRHGKDNTENSLKYEGEWKSSPDADMVMYDEKNPVTPEPVSKESPNYDYYDYKATSSRKQRSHVLFHYIETTEREIYDSTTFRPKKAIKGEVYLIKHSVPLPRAAEKTKLPSESHHELIKSRVVKLGGKTVRKQKFLSKNGTHKLVARSVSEIPPEASVEISKAVTETEPFTTEKPTHPAVVSVIPSKNETSDENSETNQSKQLTSIETTETVNSTNSPDPLDPVQDANSKGDKNKRVPRILPGKRPIKKWSAAKSQKWRLKPTKIDNCGTINCTNMW